MAQCIRWLAQKGYCPEFNHWLLGRCLVVLSRHLHGDDRMTMGTRWIRETSERLRTGSTVRRPVQARLKPVVTLLGVWKENGRVLSPVKDGWKALNSRTKQLESAVKRGDRKAVELWWGELKVLQQRMVVLLDRYDRWWDRRVKRLGARDARGRQNGAVKNAHSRLFVSKRAK